MILRLSIFLFLLLSVNTAWGATYCVRTADGGNSTQCDGSVDLATYPTGRAYDGSGTGEDCCFNHIFYATGWYGDTTTDGSAGPMVGSDTLVIMDESPVGYTSGFSGCSTGYPYGCVTREIPSGSAGNPTKIYGANHASCNDDFSNATKVWGRERAKHIFNLAGNDYIEFKCLDLTDKSSCVYNVIGQAQDGTSSYVCNRSGSYPLGDHADYGIANLTGTASNITLDHVRITGLLYGVFAQKKEDWTVNNVDISFHSVAGWDNDLEGDGVTTGNHDEGFISWDNVTMEYNGCGEVWNSRGTPYYCTSQDQSGYGDAQGTGGGNNADYTFQNVTFAHNVSDDIDNLYDDGTSTTMKVINGNFQGSSGQSIKSAAQTTHVENVIAIGNCGYFYEKSFTTFASTQSGRSGSNCDHDGVCDDNENSVGCICVNPAAGCGGAKGDCPAFNNCRAGSVLSFANKTGGQKWYNKNSTFYSNGDTVMTMNGANTCNGGTLYDNRNSVFISGTEFNDGSDKSDFFFSDGSGTCADGTFTNITGDYNYVVNSKNGSGDISGQSNSSWSASDVSRFTGAVPLNTSYLTDADIIDNFFLDAATNDADETVTCQGDCSVDFQNFDRGVSWDIGAIEFGSEPGEGGGEEEGGTYRGITGAVKIMGNVNLGGN